MLTSAPPTSVLVAVGERAYDRRLSVEQVAELRAAWAADFIGSALEAGGISHWRLDRIASRIERRVDLLPPDRRPGTWEPLLARENAFRLVRDFPEELGSPRLLLFGRRVAAAFGAGGYAFGSFLLAWDAPAVVLPHPSGRNRWWDAPRSEDTARWWVDLFSACLSGEAI